MSPQVPLTGPFPKLIFTTIITCFIAWSHCFRVTNGQFLSSDRGCISLLVLLDLNVAFDAIDHKIILNRLKNFFGISRSALAWFKLYLSDRHQFVALNEELSY